MKFVLIFLTVTTVSGLVAATHSLVLAIAFAWLALIVAAMYAIRSLNAERR